MKNIWFTSDTHFYHQNIIKYCDRPYKYAEEMTESLIKIWNETVGDNDDVYHLGDFAFCGPDKAEGVICRLKGRKHLLRGNHDHKNVLKKLEPHLAWIKDTYMLKVQDPQPQFGSKTQLIWLSHYAHRVWPQEHYGTYMLYGHSHGTLKDDSDTLSIDVGVDCFNYRPVSYEEVKQIMVNKFKKSKKLQDMFKKG